MPHGLLTSLARPSSLPPRWENLPSKVNSTKSLTFLNQVQVQLVLVPLSLLIVPQKNQFNWLHF
jgi:hypothetical protein